ncbi:MAG: hypothetical protein KDA41_06190, partial [Planctomycetales bacterium]|nr:hypothetical protein [Planctomycetales bacterium]
MPVRIAPLRYAAALWATCLLAAAAAPLPAQQRGPQTLFDFERQKLSVDWSAVGRVQAERLPLPAEAVSADAPVAGHAMRVATGGAAGVFVRPGRTSLPWQNVESVSFWIYRSPEESRQRAKSELELHFYEADGAARFWKKIDLDHAGWKECRVPLKWMRWGD